MLLERAFLAVIDATSGFRGLGRASIGERGSGYLSDGSDGRERMSAMSGVSEGDVLGGRVDEMLDLVGVMGRGG